MGRPQLSSPQPHIHIKMRFATLLAAFTFSTSISAAALWGGSSSNEQLRLALDDPLNVPGENPLVFCEDPAKNILTIDKVDLDPNPPEAGKKLSIAASGTLHEDVEEGAKVHLQVKFGLITLINQEADLCDQVDKVELSCRGRYHLESTPSSQTYIPRTATRSPA